MSAIILSYLKVFSNNFKIQSVQYLTRLIAIKTNLFCPISLDIKNLGSPTRGDPKLSNELFLYFMS